MRVISIDDGPLLMMILGNTFTCVSSAVPSPVNDLLDRGDYTLIEIFDEDDLLQVRAWRIIILLSSSSSSG